MVNALVDYLTPPGVVPLQRAVDNFDGDTLNERWTITDIGTGSGGMNDVVDGGYSMTTGTTSADARTLDFNDIRQYDFDACVFTAIVSQESTASIHTSYGVSGGSGSMTGSHRSLSNTNFRFLTYDGITANVVYTSVAADTSWHKHVGIQQASSGVYFLDDVLEVISTSNMPTAKMQPLLDVKTATSAAKTMNVRFYEVYNY